MPGKGLLKGLGITFKHTFEKDITVQYPEERPVLQERFRGCLAFDVSKCIVCGLCVKACPNRVLSYESMPRPGSKKKMLRSYTIDLQYCMFCNLCVEACRTGTLYFDHNFELSTNRRENIKIVYDFPEGAGAVEDSQVEEISEDDVKPRAEAGKGVSSARATAAGKGTGPERDAKAEQAKEKEPGTGASHEDPNLTGSVNEKVLPKDAGTDEEEIRRRKKADAFKTAIEKNPQKALARLVENEDDLALLGDIVAGDEKKTASLAGLMASDMEKAARAAQAYIKKARQDREKEGKEGNE